MPTNPVLSSPARGSAPSSGQADTGTESETRRQNRQKYWLLLLLGVAMWPLRGLAIGADSLALVNWTHEAAAQRNRALAKNIPEPIVQELLEVLAAGTRSCDCQPHKLRWAWSLPRPADRKHPAIVVAFEDRPRRGEGPILAYERFAMLVFREEHYVVSGVLSLRRPRPENNEAALRVSVKPRRDLDADGQLDLVLAFDERWPQEHVCGEARIASGAPAMVMELTDCVEQEPAGFDSSRNDAAPASDP